MTYMKNNDVHSLDIQWIYLPYSIESDSKMIAHFCHLMKTTKTKTHLLDSLLHSF